MGDQADRRSIANSVAEHYNGREQIGLHRRTQTRIYYLRNFNNWVKSCIISHTVLKIKNQIQSQISDVNQSGKTLKRKAESDSAENFKIPRKELNGSGSSFEHMRNTTDVSGHLNVLDLCCGKGGDLLKWINCDIPVKYYVAADIAKISVDQCRERYQNKRERNSSIFEAEFHSLDCTKDLLAPMLKNPEMQFDITSCQFSIHYGFESEKQARTIVRNACANVKVGGYFIGTTLNSSELLRRLLRSQKNSSEVSTSFGSEVYRIQFESPDTFPAYGAKYNFQLDGVVDCPEFLCDINLLAKLAAEYGFKLEENMTFREVFDKFKDTDNYKRLLSVINALEPFYPRSNSLSSTNREDYTHAVEYFEECLRKKREARSRDRFSVGTISKSEWEAISVYHSFIFKRVSKDPVQIDYEFDPTENLKRIRESLNDFSAMQPPLVNDYYPKRLVYAPDK